MSLTQVPATENTSKMRGVRRWFTDISPGLAVCAVAVLASLLVHALVPAVPSLTVAVVLGIAAANLPGVKIVTRDRYRPGLGFAGKKLMRVGIVLLGLKLSIVDVLDLGWVTFAVIVTVVVLAFVGTYLIARLLKLPGEVPVLLAAGFSICGASAIGAMAAARRARDQEVLVPVALVTLCGTLAIVVLPLLMPILSLDPIQFGQWAGASVHDVGQVVATAQVGGASALAAALVIKLTRVLLLAPMVFVATLTSHRGERKRQNERAESGQQRELPPLVPMFIVGFAAMIGIRSLGIVGPEILSVMAIGQDVVLGAALFGLGSAVQLRELVISGARAGLVALLSWILIAGLGYGAVQIISL